MAQDDLTREMLIVFTRFPQPGQTKTRLIPALGAAEAAALQKMMAEHTFSLCGELAGKRELALCVYYEGGDEQAVRSWVPAAMSCRSQGPGSLGDRLAQTFADSFASGGTRVIIIGSDCPFLTPEILAEGFTLLQNHDVVLGPACDGGYYLVGMSKPGQQLWSDIDWGTDRVFQQTMAIARKSGLALALLPELADIDRPEDLQHLFDASSGAHLFTSSP